jgi:hypothetical protein
MVTDAEETGQPNALAGRLVAFFQVVCFGRSDRRGCVGLAGVQS